ncbi:MAG: LysR family transcriptional regulator [Desulfovibrionaceae bacterium]
MDLCKLKTFRMAAVMLNFNKAAEALNLAQSTVSMQIRALEDELGELLFKRVHKKIMLTEAGEAMVFYADKMLSLEKEARDTISNKTRPAGTLRLLAPEAIASAYLPALIRRFLLAHPSVNFDISNCSLSGLENELRTESVDMAFIFSSHIDSINVKSEIVMNVTFAMVTHAKSMLANKKHMDVSDLNGQVVLLPKAGCGHGLLIKQLLGLDIAKPSSIIEFTSIEAIKKYVLDNDCVAVLPKTSIHNELLRQQVVELQWIHALHMDVAMVWLKQRTLSPLLRDFMALGREMATFRE